MKICFLLHFYQPHDQQDDILDRVVNESYRPLVRGLLTNSKAKLVINITGSLTKLLQEKGYSDVLTDMKTLLDRGQIEMTGSCMYHAFLPLIPREEAERQIDLDAQANREAFGENYAPVGFFSPEMAISSQVFDIVNAKGFKWIPVPEIANIAGKPSPDRIYEHKDYKGLSVFFRNKRVSSLILSSVARLSEILIKETEDLHQSDSYWFCVMDAETFGHHRIGHEKVLFDILADPFFQPVLAKDLLAEDYPREVVTLRDCTWTNSEQDFHLKENQNSFILWKDPENPIHNMQWEFTNFVIDTVSSYSDKESESYKEARSLLDKAIASDHFWWASVKPWWSLEIIEQGAFSLKHVVNVLGGDADKATADGYYRNILDKAFEWQRTGVIRKKHLENSATYLREPFKDRTPAEWYNQIILEFEDEIKSSADNMDFEKAIKWRDAVIKLKQGTDIYDVLHVVDELWSARKIPSVKPFLEHNWEELSDFAKKYLQDVMTEKDLEDWKKKKTADR